MYHEETVPVKNLPPNGLGLYEMHGNVEEWCADWFGEYPPGRVVDPQGPDKAEYRVLRGGSWFDGGGWCRSASRLRDRPGYRDFDFGLRLARGQAKQAQGAEPRGAVQTESERKGDGEALREPLFDDLYSGVEPVEQSDAGADTKKESFLRRVFKGSKKKK